MTTTLPTQARIVIIGGGIVGCSTAYHLSKIGCSDVLLLERKAQLRQNQEMTNLAKYALDDPEPMLYANEPVFRNDEVVGHIRSGAYGHFLGCAVGMGYVHNAQGVSDGWLTSGIYEIMIEGRKVPAKACLRSPYDPKNGRSKM